ncbi:hypothetical protein RFEPED_1455 [Rickettsia felis str. Pedreira]|uniref:Uncharacterized protein n=2 Tax=Rickettsia felis TaxID=42862 RepID=A0A0F3MTH4_RICFI|nr:hypothetical protein [Rickettsia felis]AAY61835.1 unknown [Rickettsia felis URRWXCal2]KHO02556.1 hypothetical protein JS55_05715 [Rickettsia felis str. LSU]KHO03188.1 hypothetical protein JS61_05490 [Rickettsia felis]KJV59058.1 hypothetical protein RFEPED_1455 [Rickettsia felis str. Pedreira]MDE8611782.1 hypothetical protein [Rickettsia felis]
MSIINFSSFSGLNKEQQEELQRLLIKLKGFTKSLKMNVKDLEDHLFYILQNSLNELSHTENIDIEKIEKLFNRTIQESLTTLSEALEKAYQEQLKTKDIFLFDGIIVEKCLNVLEQVLKFQQELDKLYPGASKKIIESLENILVGVISTQIPMLGIFIQTSGILEKVNNLIDSEKLLPKITKLHNDIKEIREEAKSNEKLENIYEKAKNVAAISEILKEPPRKIIEIANKNPNNQASLENVAKASKAIPKSKDEVEEKIAELKSNIENAIPQDINIDKLNSVKNTISDNLNEAKTELLKVLNPEASFGEKIESLCKAAEKAMEIASDIKKIVGVIPGSKELGNVISLAIKTNLLPPPVLAVAKLAPDIANLVNIGKAVVTMLSKTQNLTQQQGRAK